MRRLSKTAWGCIMTLGPNESSWVGQRAQEMLNIIEAEYIRPSVMFKPKLTRFSTDWAAEYPGMELVYGDSPDEAMRNFDKAWREKIGK